MRYIVLRDDRSTSPRSTVYRELSRNGSGDRYDPCLVQQQGLKRRVVATKLTALLDEFKPIKAQQER